jgi:hypothetical protein
MKIKRWSCPYCAQTSTRHWNLKVHIHRRHNGIGEPIQTAAVSFNSSYGAVRGQLEPAAIHSAKRDDSFRNIPARVYKTDYYPNSMSSTTENNRTSSLVQMNALATKRLIQLHYCILPYPGQ